MGGEDKESGEFASPPCSLHELDPAFAGTAPREPDDLAAWRKAERERLIDARLEIPPRERLAMSERIAAHLEAAIGDPEGLVISAYWPFRGEPELKPLLGKLAKRGARTALPVVEAKAQPLIFRLWQSGDRIEHGIWKIPIPADGAEVLPDVVIAPVVGFDPQCYRLGYGGGFFDRTLAAMKPHRARLFGVGYAMQAMPTIHPQPHDIAMDCVVTENGVLAP